MAYSDQIIKPVLLSLSEDSENITYRQVSELTGIPECTVKRSVTRMIKNGAIKREGSGRKWGYRYYDDSVCA